MVFRPQLGITHGGIDRAKEAAADEDDDADMPWAGLVKEEEVISDIEGARLDPHMGFDRPQVLCASCKPLRTATSQRAC